MTEQQKILETLEPLFEYAKEHRKWFYSSYQGLTFSPKELREHHRNGRFIWGAVNWKLIDPPKLKDLELEVKKLAQENDQLARRILQGFE